MIQYMNTVSLLFIQLITQADRQIMIMTDWFATG